MGHAIDQAVYDEKVNKDKVQKHWDSIAAHEGYMEGITCLPGKIKWHEHICNSREEAEVYIREHDNGWYNQLAVKFRDTESIPKTSAVKERLLKQIKSYREKAVEYDKTHVITAQKAEFISCPQCKSKLAKTYMGKTTGRVNCCPVCGTKDIRADYILTQLKAYEDKIQKWKAELKAEEKKLAQKVANKAKICWLVKVEYHV